jgi:DNA-binding response OmpR family regulator
VVSSQPSPAIRVLLVEENRDSREMYAMYLQFSGLEVLEAGDGQTALELTRTGRPSVVVTDLSIPGLSGVELCRQIKGDPEMQRIPVIVVTGQGVDAATLQMGDCGCEKILIKPCPPDQLVAEVRRLVGI